MQTQTKAQVYANRFQDLRAQKKKENTLIRIFLDTSLANGHDGLREIARKEQILVDQLNVGEFVIFINRSKTALKMFAPANILVYLKMPGASRLNMRALRFIPRVFNAKEMVINYPQALNLALDEEFKIRERQKQ